MYINNEFILLGMLERWFPKFNSSSNYFKYRRYLIKQFCVWHSFLIEKKISLIIYPSVPHRIFDYIVYLIAKEIGIKIVITILTDSYKKGITFTNNLNDRSINFIIINMKKKKFVYENKIKDYLGTSNYKAKHFMKKRFSTLNKFFLLIKKFLRSPYIHLIKKSRLFPY